MKWIITLLFFFVIHFSWTQEINYHFVDDIKFLKQDKFGFIYLISNQSICKFDGKEVHSSCLHLDEQINDVLILSEHDYFVAIANKLVRYQNKQKANEHLFDEIITSLELYETGFLIGTSGNGLFFYSFDTEEILKLKVKGFVNDIATVNNKIFVITDTELIKIDEKLNSIKSVSLFELLPKQIVAYGEHEIAILMNDGKVVFANSNLDFFHTFHSESFKPIEITGENGLLYAIDKHTLKEWRNSEFIQIKNGDFEHVTKVQSLLLTTHNNSVKSINVLSEIFGIDKTFSIYSFNNQFLLGREGSISLFQNGDVLRNIDFPHKFKSSYVSSIIVHGNSIYAGTMGKGILVFNLDKSEFSHLFKDQSQTINEKNIIKLHSENNQLWVGYLNGLKVFDINSQELVNDYKELLKDNYLYTFYVKNENDFFLGTSNNGLIHVENGRPEYYFKGSSVYSIVDTPKGVVFSVEGKGIYLLKNAKTINLSSQYFFRSNNIYNIMYVNDNVLFSNEFGVDILNLNSRKMDYVSKEILSDIQLNSNAFNSTHSLIAYGNGILQFNNSLLDEAHNNELVLEPPLLYDEAIKEEKNEFNYDDNVWSFLFESQNYYAPSQRYYKYRLHPLEEEWKNTTQEKVTYYNLSSGNYTFEVSSGGHRNFMPTHIKNYHFIIKKPFWMQPWFWGILFFVLVILVYVIVKYREQQVIKKEQLKSVEIQYEYQRLKDQINPHFLFNSFNSLIGIVEDNPDKATKVLEKLSAMYRTILKHEKSEVISLFEELELAQQYFEIHKIRYQDLIQLKIHNVDKANKKYVIPFSIQLLIENAIKHNIINKKSKLKVTIEEEQEFLIISNNINKKNKNVLSLGLGLENLIKRHEMILKKKPIVEENDTTFKVKIPYIDE
ncbi:histidine kinase [Pontimicrobium sp. IMCC45349]|uniref:sensor histidine kinase n=1 Tax=Pontimicrobium sp. IMCC45349 TaxID=3391574 RepID=UPI00399FC777